MDGRAFLNVARRLFRDRTEADWRTATGRAYYGLLLEGKAVLQRWGFAMPPHERLHRFVRLCFYLAPHAELKKIGLVLESLGKWRNEADYEPEKPGRFASPATAQLAVTDATNALELLDQIDADPGRCAAAIGVVRPPP